MVVFMIFAAYLQASRIFSVDNKIWFWFFSRNQMFNDSVFLFLHVLVFYLVTNVWLYIGGKRLYLLFERVATYKYFNLFLWILPTLFFMWVYYFFFFSKSNMYYSLCIWFILLWFIFWLIAGIEIVLNKMVTRESIVSNIIMFMCIGFSLIWTFFYSSIYENLYTKINNEEIKIEYMNDQYIFSSGLVYSIDGNMIFYKK